MNASSSSRVPLRSAAWLVPRLRSLLTRLLASETRSWPSTPSARAISLGLRRLQELPWEVLMLECRHACSERPELFHDAPPLTRRSSITWRSAHVCLLFEDGVVTTKGGENCDIRPDTAHGNGFSKATTPKCVCACPAGWVSYNSIPGTRLALQHRDRLPGRADGRPAMTPIRSMAEAFLWPVGGRRPPGCCSAASCAGSRVPRADALGRDPCRAEATMSRQDAAGCGGEVDGLGEVLHGC